MLLEGKRLLVTGVLTEASLAFAVARLAQEQGGQIVLTSFGRPMNLTRRSARRLPDPPDVLELDITDPSHLARLGEDLDGRWGGLDGVLHAIGFAPEACLGGDIMRARWDDVATALHVSAYSLKALAEMASPLMKKAGGGSIVGLDFDARQAWPSYDWMGVAKAALESCARYLARDLGPQNVRVNLVAAGPQRTVAARGIPGFDAFEEAWAARAPLGWEVGDAEPVARACVALLSDWFPATTGEILHVDGGYHAMGA
ncbi:MAG: enoyl-ACP reductase FabI [Actinomycetota bacterium]|jgi:enoyl ACP reductase|nr:enoyl-ACP reductase FabI [Actinomycetota bacterium]PLS75317.1 MAG: enoyl-[acyl-carrier-protein] reductase FabI [Actinomycetota bacterium]